MSWKDRFRRDASFKGIPFYVESYELNVSNSIVVNSYPFSNKHKTDNLGPNPLSDQIRGYLLGDDYDLDRERLIAACQDGKSGKLVHPYLGEKEVEIQNLSIRESKTQLRYLEFVLKWVEAGIDARPEVTIDSANNVASIANQTNSISNNEFFSAFEDIRLASQNFIEQVTSTIEDRLQFINDAVTSAKNAYQNVNELVEPVFQLQSTLKSAIRSPELVAEILDSTFSLFERAEANFGDIFQDLSTILLEQPSSPLRGAENAEENVTNAINFKIRQAAITTKSTVLSNYVRLEQTVEPKTIAAILSQEEFRIEVERSEKEIDEQLQVIESPELYFSMVDLKSSAIELTRDERVTSLPNLRRESFKKDLPIVVIASKIYGDPEYSDELIRRNRVKNPLFFPKDQVIEYVRE